MSLRGLRSKKCWPFHSCDVVDEFLTWATALYIFGPHKELFICFSKTIFWLVCLLFNNYCAAITQAQFTERNAVNFLLAPGGYGLFFLLLGAKSLFFFLLPSLTSFIRVWLYRESAKVSIKSYRLKFGYSSSSLQHLQLQTLRSYSFLVTDQGPNLCFLNRNFEGTGS